MSPSKSGTPKGINYSQGVMGSKGPTLSPVKTKTFYGDTYVPTNKTTTSNNTNSGTDRSGRYDKTLVGSVQSGAYWDYVQSNKPSTQQVSGGGAGSAPVSTTAAPTTAIKLPDKDNLFSLQNNPDVALITSMVFEKLGAVELTKFTRSDTVEGINPYYNIISNLDQIKKEFDTSNLVLSQKSDTSLYNAFSIKLSTKIPKDEFLEERGLDNYIYIDEDGSLIIELDNITQDELVEIEIDTNGTIVEVRT